MKYLRIADLAKRWSCKIHAARAAVNRADFPKAVMPTGSVRLRLWSEAEVEKWEARDGRKEAA